MEAKTEQIQVQMTEFAEVYSSLIRLLAASGLPAQRSAEIFENHVRAQCILCGIRLTGNEFSRLAKASNASELADPKLNRLFKGYCGRTHCESYFYCLSFDRCAGVDWAQILRDIHLPPAPPVAEAEPLPKQRFLEKFQTKRTAQVVAAGFLVMLLYVYHLNRTGQRIPLLQKQNIYQVNSSMPAQ